ncbi:MAG: ABC transporter ATP-binding protein [Lentisphaerae bacterium]|nr:ABC transporter ATP-binding protein [Lentisphaerota bacterium]MBR2871967.1 ABC transporter ATP-binding protein [Lentisphaeria bacterium]
MSLLKVENLSVGFRRGAEVLNVINGVSFEVERGEILALVGESGCGKSAGCLALTRLNAGQAVIDADSALFEKRSGEKVELFSLLPKELRKIRGGGIAYIFQEPLSSLNPVFRIGDQIAEVLALHRKEIKDLQTEVERLLGAVGIPDPKARMKNFPHELSGGMQQRVMIAMALAGNPDLLIADEPTTALDVTIQAQIIELMEQLRRENGTSIILITHNFGVVAQLADRVAVMYAGRIVESAPVAELISNPQHPYTKALLAAVPVLGGDGQKLVTIPGQVPSPENFPAGCRFCGRCRECSGELEKVCAAKVPGNVELSSGHKVACWKFAETLPECR